MSDFLKPKREQPTNVPWKRVASKPVTVEITADKPTTAELKHRNSRKKKKRITQASRKANRR